MFTLQTLRAEPDALRREVAESSGFSLHAGIAARGEVLVSDRQRAMSWAQRLKCVFAIDIPQGALS